MKQLLRSWETASWFFQKTEREHDTTMKSCQRRTFCAHREPIIGMQGQEQPAAQFSKAGHMTARMYSRLLVSLKVMVKLTRTATGSGRVKGDVPATRFVQKHWLFSKRKAAEQSIIEM